MNTALQVYIITVVVGLFLIAAEIFLPGGVIGAMGGVSLAVAMVLGFFAFGPQGGFVSALLLIILGGAFIMAVIKFFPRTRMGRNLTLDADGKSFKSAPPDLMKLEGQDGVALTVLRPSGMARIDGQRVDVVADGSFIETGRPVHVVRVEGSRVLVREASAPTPERAP